MGACTSKCKTIEGKAPQVHEAPAQQTPKVAPDTTVFSTDQVAADQTPKKGMVEEEAAKEEPAAVPAPEFPTDAVVAKEKVEVATTPEPVIDDKKEEAVEEKIVVEEEKPSASPIIEEETATVAVVEVAEEKPSAATAVVEVVEENTTEVAIKNVEEEKATQQS